jgi:hypothetical protein
MLLLGYARSNDVPPEVPPTPSVGASIRVTTGLLEGRHGHVKALNTSTAWLSLNGIRHTVTVPAGLLELA